MLTVLQINPVVNTGSTGRIVEEIGKCAIKRGWNSFIAYSRGNPVSESNLIRIGSKFDMYLHALEARLRDNCGLASRDATKNFIKDIERIRPDVIHVHLLHGYYINYKILFDYLNNNRIPSVMTMHDCWCMTGHCAYYIYSSCDRWKTKCQKCSMHGTFPSSFIDRSSINYEIKRSCFCDRKWLTIVAVSDWLKKEIAQSFLKGNKIKRIYNGVDTNVFKPLSFMGENICKKQNFTILAVASIFDFRKGFNDFLKLSTMLYEDERIVLVGVTKDQIKSLPNNIIGIERTENVKQLVELYNKSDVVISLSLAETFGMTIIEGMSCGTPVVVYDNTGQAELITDETGIAVTTGDVYGILKAIRLIKSNGKNYYSTKCRKHVMELFDKNDCFMQYIDLYESICS